MNYSLKTLSVICNGKLRGNPNIDIPINEFAFDTRKLVEVHHTAFIALVARRDGHDFIPQAYEKGCRRFIISKVINYALFPQAAFLKVGDTLQALQNLAVYHRKGVDLDIIGITGSNGKTIVKEWLGLLLETKFALTKSPKGWNSLLGVGLSILEIEDRHNLAIIETGISQQDEMSVMSNMVNPSYGLITNIGDAHESGFDSIEDKLKEKLLLFKSCNSIFYNKDQTLVSTKVEECYPSKELVSWSTTGAKASYQYSIKSKGGQTTITLSHSIDNDPIIFRTKVKGEMYLENLLHSITIALHLGISTEIIQRRLPLLKPIPYRSQILAGKNDCIVIDDSYSFDKKSMMSAANLLTENAGDRKKVVIISDVSSHINKKEFYTQIGEVLSQNKVDQVLHIGNDGKIAGKQLSSFDFANFPDLLGIQAYLIKKQYDQTAFLIKGARHFELEKISSLLAERTHTSLLTIDLEAISHNIGVYSSYLSNQTKIMSIIKASAYGSGSTELAKHLEKQGVYALAVATIDEGVVLRKDGITLPILILNPVPDGFHLLPEYNLEPEVHSIPILEQLIPFTLDKGIKIHIKLDTGMNRFGFDNSEFEALVSLLHKGKMEVHSVFSHLSASGDSTKQEFTLRQLSTFDAWSTELIGLLKEKPLRHILNTNGVLYYTDYQYDMIRMGLGMYGVTKNKVAKNRAKTAHRLTSEIVHIKEVKKGETVGYGAEFFIEENKTIAQVPIGYADGIMRNMSHGRVSFWINGHLCPTIGFVCMDMLMLDITGHKDIETGDVVEIFGDNVDIYSLADRCETIPYEILTKISQRVKRVYIQD